MTTPIARGPVWLLPVALMVAAAAGTADENGAERRVSNAWALPELRLPGLDGAEHGLSEWRGRVILLNFWATWCPPCRAEVPVLVDVQARLGARGLQVVSVGLDEERKVRNFVRTLGINYPVLLADPQRDTTLLPLWGDRQYVLPYSVIIAPDGSVHFTHQGPLDEEAVRVHVMPLLAPEPASPENRGGG
jgi:thiol-disulfide isomerase/thioredoxin